jgi:hypothetical protein
MARNNKNYSKLHEEALAIFGEIQPSKTITDYNKRRKELTKKLKPILAEMQERFEIGATIGGCTSFKQYCEMYKPQGCYTYARVRQIITGKSGNENKGKVKSLDLGDVVRIQGVEYDVVQDAQGAPTLVVRGGVVVITPKAKAKITHVLGMQWANTSGPSYDQDFIGGETACGRDSGKVAMAASGEAPTCKSCADTLRIQAGWKKEDAIAKAKTARNLALRALVGSPQ